MATENPNTPEAWGAASRGYATIAPTFMERYADAIVERLDLDASHSVLEVAAGTGALTLSLAARAGSVLATDFAPQMLEVLRERLDASGHDNVTLAVMDGQALTVDDGSFDRAASSFGLMLFPERARGFSELRRALRPGGRVTVSGWAGPEKLEVFAIFMGAMQRAFPDLPPPSSPPPLFSLADTDQFAAELEAAGFADVAVDEVERVLVLDGADALWSMLTVGAPPVQVMFDRIGHAGRDRLKASLYEAVEARWGDGPIRLANTATVGHGTAA